MQGGEPTPILDGRTMKQTEDWHLTDSVQHEMGRGDPFAAAIRGTRMPMVITDPRQDDNPIVFANLAFQTLTGYERDEILGRNCRFLQGPDTDPAAIAQIRDAIARDTSVQVDLLNYRKDGSYFWNALYLSPVRSDDGQVQFYFASQLDVTDRVDAQALIEQQKAVVEREVAARTADLEAALEAKTLLLHEVDHRVKNNLTMIGALIRLQMRAIGDAAMQGKLEAMLERIDALATVHRQLYQADDVTRIDIAELAGNLADDIIGASGRTDIVLNVDLAPIQVPASFASALGLVINELVTNAVKHAYRDGRGGRLSLSGHARGDQGVIVVADDGHGLPADNGTGDGLGRTLISRLSRQVGAEVSWNDAAPGTKITLVFPLKV